MSRQTVSTGSSYEELMGYARAVSQSGHVFVSGCSGLAQEGAAHGDATVQFARAVEKVARVLGQAGASLADVVRSRVYLTDPQDWQALIRAHGVAFSAIRPACTMVLVAGLIDPAMKVELEVTAMKDA
ncbi:putative translation initiation inhibitor YjgF [Acetobacter estunensis NRIC 0472]|uniref:RidA family protein n=1 Tax=Acetobacter estunensis TaxID=104097 RepID=A0A967B9T9_9PROT|nr:RidA family protein [Acetobacter estunensis]NHO52397.1 RidA family protein [Acetobacter estunensis]GBQ25875.1 putative translation initiation inhibitor YjgF [Acetobacter estunensis NRIC 0472]